MIKFKFCVNEFRFVALGTSLPDMFASAIAAKKEKTADNAIGFIIKYSKL